MPTSILIIGGGFGGVMAAKRLAAEQDPDTTIRLVDPKAYFEYHAALYRFITGRSPMEVCLPYRDIFGSANIDVVKDRIASIDVQKHVAVGDSGSHYHYDTLILALGSETCYFSTSGVAELSFGMKSANEAVKLKEHISEMFAQATTAEADERAALLHIVIVGGGASGVELAGELSWYAASLARSHNLDPALVSIEIIEGMPRLLPLLSEKIAGNVLRRLRSLGVTVTLNQTVQKQDKNSISLKDRQIQTKTVIWTAGMSGCCLVKSIAGLPTDRRCRIEVDPQLRAVGHDNVFVVGDAAATKYSGMAQTALRDGAFVSSVINAQKKGLPLPVHVLRQPIYAVPVGPKWAAVAIGSLTLTGRSGWLVRRICDFCVFLILLPFGQALTALRAGTQSLSEV